MLIAVRRASLNAGSNCWRCFITRFSCFARAAILEGVSVSVKDFVRFTDGSDTFPTTYLVRHSLHSLVSLFIRAQFLEQRNKWPITVQSAGVSYHAKLRGGRRNAKALPPQLVNVGESASCATLMGERVGTQDRFEGGKEGTWSAGAISLNVLRIHDWESCRAFFPDIVVLG
ncbi:hypothetical protein ANCCAN_23363 [Ancylostoma caninum]|uniref:Uncharacterized protein n=1 Tax=Ancylostoma caninum TaxID=29170 RepID=A0A368FFB1_ANCCA|nr:hypothetical protein ANCCAN_23363 [Ancylostoma caninum]